MAQESGLLRDALQRLQPQAGAGGHAGDVAVSVDGAPPLPAWYSRRSLITGGPLVAAESSIISAATARVPRSLQPSVTVEAQEVTAMEDVLNAMMGIEGEFIRTVRGELMVVDTGLDVGVAEMLRRVLPMCTAYVRVNAFVAERDRFEYGLVSHALSAAIFALLKEYLLLVAQLEHQLRQGALTLQKLWFYIQPSLQTMHVLQVVTADIAGSKAIGGALLNRIAALAHTMGGDKQTRDLFFYLMEQASQPYFELVTAWIYRGTVEDKYREFFIEQNLAQRKESLTDDATESYWQHRYTLRKEQLPQFLEKIGDKMFQTGKYLNVIRESGVEVVCPFAQPIQYTLNDREYIQKIDRAFEFAAERLMDLMMREKQLLRCLHALKHFFLLDNGDFVVSFMDSARAELSKQASKVSQSKLEALFDLSLRQSVVGTDLFKEHVTCVLLPYTLRDHLSRIHGATSRRGTDVAADLPSSLDSITGFQAFAFEFKVRWPLSLLVNKMTVTKYQLLFRHLFHCRNVESRLGAAWLNDQSTKEYDLRRELARTYGLRHRMVHFLKNFIHYMTYEVLEPLWHTFEQKMAASKTIDEVMKHHQDFLDSSLKGCMLTNLDLFKLVSNLLSVCVIFADQSERFVNSLTVPPDALGSAVAVAPASSKPAGSMRARQESIEVARAHVRRTVSDEAHQRTIGQVEETFNKQLRSLLEALTAFSVKEADTHLTALVQRLDYNAFYAGFFGGSTAAVAATAGRR